MTASLGHLQPNVIPSKDPAAQAQPSQPKPAIKETKVEDLKPKSPTTPGGTPSRKGINAGS